MQLSDASRLAHRELERHGLTERGWTFGFDQGSRRFGCCRYRTKQITLSRVCTLANDESTVLRVILHEVAHALHILEGNPPGHDARWSAICKAIGGDGQRIIHDSAPIPRRVGISIRDIGKG